MVAIGSNGKSGGGRREHSICYQIINISHNHRIALKTYQNGNVNSLIISENRCGYYIVVPLRNLPGLAGSHGESWTLAKT